MAHTHKATQSSGGRRKEALNTAQSYDPNVLPCAQNPPFIFAHWPDNWEMKLIDGEWVPLPRVKMLRLEPGVNGVRGESYKSVDPRIFFAMLMAEGAVIIHNDVPVVYYDDETDELVQDTGYLESEACTNGRVYVSCWDRPQITKKGRKRKVDWKTGKDKDGFNEWLLLLVAEGIIPKPTEAGLNHLVQMQEVRAARMAGRASNDYTEALVKREQARLEALLLQRAEMYDRAPRRRRSKRKESFTDDVTPRGEVKANPCTGITSKGLRCQRAAKPGSKLCSTHMGAASE